MSDKTCFFCLCVVSIRWHKKDTICNSCYDKNRAKSKPYLGLVCQKCGPKKAKTLIGGLCKNCYSKRKEKPISCCISCKEIKQSKFVRNLCQKCYTAQNRINHPETYLKSQEKNKVKNREKVRLYDLKNPEKRAAREANRRAKQNKATILSSDLENIRKIYENRPKDQEVDHIIPLKHKNVCGLHVSWNLQYLTSLENRTKNNKFDGTSSNEGWRK